MSTARPLEGRIAVVTGASAGIGKATAFRLAEDGAQVIINARRADKLDRVEAEIDAIAGDEVAQPVPGDASDQRTIDTILSVAHDRFGGPPDLVVVNAGRGLKGSAITSDPGEWEELITTNLTGAARLMRAAAAVMTRNPPADPTAPGATPRDIIAIGSVVGRHVSPFSSMYGSTKFAVHALTEALRRELAPAAIRVGLVAPGFVETEFQGVAGYDDEMVSGFREKSGPLLTAADIADAIAHMASQPPHRAIAEMVVRPTRQEYP